MNEMEKQLTGRKLTRTLWYIGFNTVMDFMVNNVNLRQNVDFSQLTFEHFFVDSVNWRTTGDLHLSFVLYPNGGNLPRTTGDSRA